jgi:hypothetical protein
VQGCFNLIYYPKVSHGTQSQAIGNFPTEAMANLSCAPLNPFLGQSTSEKLMKGNHTLWKAQILTGMRDTRLEDSSRAQQRLPNRRYSKVARKSQIHCMNNGRPPISRCWDTCFSTCQETLSSKSFSLQDGGRSLGIP